MQTKILSLLKRGKPHISAEGALVKWKGLKNPRDAFSALIELSDALDRLGVEFVKSEIKIPAGCDGCNDPGCTYDSPEAFFLIKFSEPPDVMRAIPRAS